MAYSQSTYHSRIYRDFKEIEASSFRKIIHFFEQKEEAIRQLEFDEYFEMLQSYVDALFEIGAYAKHLLMVDVVIEHSITYNIQFRKGEDIFQRMLFKKAASCYNLREYDRADYILRELIKIDPYDRDVSLFLKKCLRRKHPQMVYRSRAASIFLFLMTAFIISLEVLLIRPFYRMHVPTVEASRLSLFFLGCLVLVGGDLLHRWKVEREVNAFVAFVKRQKRSI